MAAETSAALPFLESRSGIRGLTAAGRRRSAETDLLGHEVGLFDTGVEFREIKGDGYLLEEEEDEETEDEFDVEVEVEGDIYLEETTLDLGFLWLFATPLLLSFSDGNNGGLLECSSCAAAAAVLGFCGPVVEAAPETAATIITINNTCTL